MMTAEQPTLPSAPPKVHNGTYTVQDTVRGQHFTVKLHTAMKGKLAGKRILSLMTGPDNESSFTGVAFWDEDAAPRPRAWVWRKHKGVDPGSTPIDGMHWRKKGWSRAEQKLAIWCDLATRGATEERRGYWYGSGYRLLLEGRCVKCNRKLTTPESIERGIGPVCEGKGR